MAAGQSVQVTLGFRADTSGAKQAIQELNTQLNKIQDLNMDKLHISRELNEASNAAKILQQNLQAAFNAKTGQIDMTKFAASLRQAGTSVTQLGQQLMNAGASGTAAFASLGRTIAAMDVPLKQTNATVKNMMTTLKNTAKWQISSNLIHGLQSAFSGALQYARELNQSLTDIRIVSGASVEEMSRFAAEANKAAKSLGTTTKSYADAAKLFYQQGDTPEQAAKKAEITLKATNAAFKASASEMSEYLTAVWNSYQAGTDQLQSMVDVMAALGATTATSMEEIATSLQKVAATANNVGVSMEQMSSMIATISSATRLSAETVGTSMNTVLARMGSLKLGETLEDGVNLTKYTSALKSVGVEVLTTSGQMRNMGVIIEELGAKWQTMSKAQQTALANTIGGARQYTNLMALFSNWDKYQQNMQTALNSGGALDKMQEKYMQGWEGASKRLKASIEGIYSALIDDQGIIKFTNSLAKVVDQIENIIDSFGGFSGILTQLGAIALQVFSNNIGANLTKAINQIATFKNSFSDLGNMINGKQLSELTRWEKMQNFGRALSMTTNERIYRQQNLQAQAGLREAQDRGDYGLQAQITASQTLLEKKLALQNAEMNMTDAQKRNAQASLASLTAQAAEIDKLATAYQEANKELQTQERSLTSIQTLKATAKNASEQSGLRALVENDKMTAEELRNAYNRAALKEMQNMTLSSGLFNFDNSKLNETTNNLDILFQRFEKLNSAATHVNSASEMIRGALRKISEGDAKTAATELQSLTTDLETLRNSMKDTGQNTQFIDKMITDLTKLNADGTVNIEATTKALMQFTTQLDQISLNSDKDIKAVALALQHLGYTEADIDKLATAFQLTTDQTIRLKQAMADLTSTSGRMSAELQKTMSNLQAGISQATRLVGGLTGSFTSMFNLIANWDTSNLTSKVMGFTSTITQTLNSIMSGAATGAMLGGKTAGGWGALIGGVLGLSGSVVGYIMGQNELDNKRQQESIAKTYKQSKTVGATTQEEVTAAQSLIATYNQLYETYLKTGEGQNELLETAIEIANVYGIQGAAVLAASGNFELFNQKIRESLNYSKLLERAQTNLTQSATTMSDAISLNGLSSTVKGNAVNREGDWKLSNILSLSTAADYGSIDFNQISLGSPEAQQWLTNILTSGARPSNGSWWGNNSTGTLLVQAFMDGLKLDTRKINTDVWGNSGSWGSSGSGRWSGVADRRGADVVTDLYSWYGEDLAGITLADFFEKTHYINGNGFGGPFYNGGNGLSNKALPLMAYAPNSWLPTGNMQSPVYNTINSWLGEGGKYSGLLTGDNQIGITAIDDPYEAKRQFQLMVDWQTEVNNLLNSEELQGDRFAGLKAVLKNLQTALNQITGSSVGDTPLEDYINGAVARADEVNKILRLQASVKNMFGRNEKNTTFAEYMQYVTDLETVIDLNKDNMDELKDFHGQSISEMDDETLSKYYAARQKIIDGIIADTTAFDEYGAMLSVVNNTFTTEGVTDEAKRAKILQSKQQLLQLIEKAHLTELSSKTLAALQYLLDNNIPLFDEMGNITQTVQEILDANGTPDTTFKSTKYRTAKESLKKNMGQSDLETLRSSFFTTERNAAGQWETKASDGTTWQDFLAKNYNEREAWIDRMIEQATTQDRERFTTMKRESQEAADVLRTSMITQFGDSELFKYLDQNYNKLTDSYDRYQYSMSQYFETSANGFKLKTLKDGETYADWIVQAFGEDNVKAGFEIASDQYGAAFGHFLKQEVDSEGNALYDPEKIDALLASEGGYQKLMAAYATWMGYNADTRTAQDFIDILDGMGEAADNAATRISRLASAMSSLPSSEAEMTKLLKVINSNDEYIHADEQVVNGTAAGLYLSSGRLVAHNARHDYTAAELQSMFHDNFAGYQNLLVESMERESDGSVQALEQIYQAKLTQAQNLAQNTAALSTGGISLSDDLSQLQNALSALQTIDITSVPKKGTEAYNALGEAIKQSGESVDQAMQRFANMDEFTRNSTLYQAMNSNLKDQKTNVEQQAQAWANAFKTFNGKEYDFAAMYRGEQVLPTDPNVLAAYEKYVGYLRQGAEYEAQIASNSEKEATARTNIYTTQAKQTQARQQASLQEANKQVSAAQLLLNNQTGDLTAVQRHQLTAANIDTSAYDRATTAAQRATAASQIYATAIEKVQAAYQEQNDDIDEFVNHVDAAKHWLEGRGIAESGYAATTANGARDMFERMGFSKDAIEQAMQTYENLVAQGKITATTTNAEVLTLITDGLKQTKTANTQAWQGFQATALDAIKSVYSNMATEAQQAAANQISIWQSTFSTIASLMKSALSGNLFQEITSNWDTYLTAYLNSSYKGNATGFSTAIRNGTFKSSDFTLPTYDSQAILDSMGLGNNGLFNSEGRLITYEGALEAGRQIARDEGLTDSDQINSAAAGYVDTWMDIMLQQAFKDATPEARTEIKSRWKSGPNKLTGDELTAINGARSDVAALAAQYGIDLNTATALTNISTARQGAASRAQSGSTASAYQSQASSAQNIIGQIISAMESGDTYDQAVARLGLSSEQIASLTTGHSDTAFSSTATANSLAYWKDAWKYQSEEEATQYNQAIAEAEAALHDAEIERQLITGTYKDEKTGEVSRTATLSDGTVISYDESLAFVGNDNERVKELDREIASKRAQIGVKRTGTTYDASKTENTVQKMSRLSSAMSGVPQTATDIDKLVALMGGTHTATNLMTNWNTNRKQYYTDLISAMDTQLAKFTTEEQKASAEYQALNAQRQAAQEQADQWSFQTGIVPYNQELERLKTNLETIKSIDFNTWTEQNAATQLKFAQALGLTVEQLQNLSEEDFITKKYGAIKSNLESQKTQAQNIATAYLEQVKNDEGYKDFANIYKQVSSGEATLESFGLSDTMLAAYEQYASYMRQVQQYEDQIANNDFAQAQEEKAVATRKRNNAEQSQIEQWNKELEEFNKKSEKAKNVYEALSSSIETGQLTQAQKTNFIKDSPLLTMWKQATTAAERARVAMAAAYEATSTQQEAIDKQIAATKKFNNANLYNGKAYTHIGDGSHNGAGRYKANWEDESSFIENVFGKGLSNAEVSVLSQAYQATVKIVPEWKNDPREFMTQFYSQLSNLNTEYTEQQTELMAQLTDNITNLYSTLGAQEQAAAQAAVQAWTSAFNQIKSIRQSLLSGGSAMELIASSPEQAITMWQGYLKKNPSASVNDFLTAAGSGQITADTYGYATAESYLTNARKQYGIDYATWELDGKTYYGAGANFDKSMDRAAAALGVTYDAKGGNVKWHAGENGEDGYFTIGDSQEHFTAAQLTEKASTGGLTIGQDQMQAYLTPFWSSALQQTTNAATGQNYTAKEATALIAAAMSGGQDSKEWATLTTALGTVDSGLQVFAGALQRSTAATEAFTEAQHKAEENETKANNASRLSSVLESFATDTSGTSWEDYAKQHGLTDTEILSGVTRENARTTADTYWQNEIKAYESAATDYTTAANGLLKKGFTTESVEYKRLMRAAEQETQKAAAARGRQLSADATHDESEKQKTMQKAISPAQDNIKQLGESLSVLENLDLSSAPMKGTDAYNKLTAAIQACNTAAGETKYTIEQLTKGNMIDRITAKYAMQKQLLLEQAKEQDKIVAAYEKRYDFENENYDWEQAVKNGQESEYQAYLDAKRQAQTYRSQAAATDQAEQSEKTTEYANAYARVEEQANRAQEQIQKLQNSATTLGSHILDGFIDAETRATLLANGMSEAAIAAFENSATAAERATIAAGAWSKTMVAGEKDLITQNSLIDQASAGLILQTGKQGSFANMLKTGWGLLTGDKTSKDSNAAIASRNKDAFLASLEGLSTEAKGLIGKAWDDAMSTVGTSGTDAAFIAAMQNYLTRAKAENVETWNQISAQAVTSMTAAYSSMTSEAQAAAQSTIDIWKNVFDTIANLMEGLASGEKLGSLLAGDVDSTIIALTQIMDKYGITAAQAKEGLLAGKYGLSDFSLSSYSDYDAYAKSKGYDFLAKGSLSQAYAANGAMQQQIERYVKDDGTVGYRYHSGWTQNPKTKQYERLYTDVNESEFARQEATRSAIRAAVTNISSSLTRDKSGKINGMWASVDELTTALFNGSTQAWAFVQAQTKVVKAGYEAAGELDELSTQYKIDKTEAETKYDKAVEQQTAAQTAYETITNDWTNNMTTADRINSLRSATGLDDASLLQMLNTATGKEYTSLEDALNPLNNSAADLATALDSSAGTFAQTVIAAAQAFSDIVNKKEYSQVSSEADENTAKEYMANAQQGKAAWAETQLSKVMSEGGWSTQGELIQAVKNRDQISGPTSLTDSDFDTTQELQFWGQAALNFDAVTIALKTMHDAVSSSSGALAVLNNETKDMQERLSALTTLQEALTAIFGDSISFDATWIKNHTEDLKKLGKTGKEAQEALTNLRKELLAETAQKEGWSGSDQLSNLIGQYTYGEKLNQQDLQRVQNFIKENKLNEKQIQQLGKILGLTFNIVKSTKVPTTKEEVKALKEEVAETIKLDKAGKANDTQRNQAASKFVAMMASGKAEAKELKEQWQTMTPEMQNAVLATAAMTGNMQLFSQALELATGQSLQDLQNIEVTADGTVVWQNANDPSEYITKDLDGTITYHANGADIKMTKKTETAQNTTSTSFSGQVSIGGLTQKFEGNYESQGTSTTEIPVIDGTNISDATGGGDDNTGKKGGGGGGGGNKPKKSWKASKSETTETEEFHVITQIIEKLEKQLDKLDKVKNRAFGANHLKAMKDEISALRQMTAYQVAYLNEVQAKMDSTSALLIKNGVKESDLQDGILNNYAKYYYEWANDYNKVMEWWNNLSAKQQESEANKAKLEEAEKQWEERQELLENWENYADTVEDIKNQILDYQNQISASWAEFVKEKITLKVELDQYDLDALDRIISRYEDRLNGRITTRNGVNTDKVLTSYQQKMNKWATWNEKGEITGGELGSLLDRVKEAEKLHKAYEENKDNPLFTGDWLTDADYADVLKEISSQWTEILGNIEDTMASMSEVYTNMLDMTDEAFDKGNAKLEHAKTMMEGYVELQQLMGRGERASELTGFYNTTYRADQAKLAQSTTHLEELRAQRAEYAKQLEGLSEDSTWYNNIKSNIDALDERIQQAEEDQLENWKATLEDAQTLLENRGQAFLETFDDQINEMFNMTRGLSELEDDYTWYKEQQEMYVSTAKELYEVSKLNRQINNSIADSTTKASKERLKLLQQEINAQEEKNQLTEYDIKMFELQYKHALALQELEDAKNAKSTVRLTRDENGNYGYQYTADDDAIDEANQKVEDTLQQINELAAERTAELEQMQLDTMRNYSDKVKEILADRTLSEEQQAAKLADLSQQTSAKLLYIQEQYDRASSALVENQTYIQKRYGETILENTGHLQDQLSAQLGVFIGGNEQLSQKILDAVGGNGDLTAALAEYGINVKGANDAAKQTWDDVTGSVDTYTQSIKDAETELGKMNDKFKLLSETIIKQMGDWKNLGGAFDDFLKHADEQGLQRINSLIQTLAGNYEEETPGSENPTEANKTRYGYVWAYDKYSGTNTGYATEEEAIRNAKQKIRETYTTLISSVTDDEKGTGAAKVSAYRAAMQAAINTFEAEAKAGTSATNAVFKYTAYHTGGLNDFTGPAWLDGTPQKPEMVLNATDTANMLDVVNGVRELINNNVLGMLYAFGDLVSPGVHDKTTMLEQNVHITAEFPNAIDHNEIEEAFNDIINLASQYANRTK